MSELMVTEGGVPTDPDSAAYGEVLSLDWADRLEQRAHPLDGSALWTSPATTGARHRQPLVLLHGVGNDGATFGPILPVLAEHRPVLAPHLNPELLTDSEDRAEAVAGLVEFLGAIAPPPWRLVGHSMGGVLTGLLLRARPDLVHGAVRLNTPLPGVSYRIRTGDTLDRTGRALLSLKALAQVTALGRPRLPGFLGGVEITVVRNALRGFVADPGALDADVIRGAVIEARTRDADRFMRLARHLPDWELEPFTEAPVHVIAGADDPLLPPPDLDRVARAYPAATMEIVPGVGHFAHLEVPRRTVDAIADAFADNGRRWSPRRRSASQRASAGRRRSRRRTG